MKSTNIPYVKVYDKNGILKNPIIGIYCTGGLNREKRKAADDKKRKVVHNYKIGGCMARQLGAIFIPKKKRAKDIIRKRSHNG